MLVFTPILRRFGALLACMAWAALGAPMAQASVAAPRRSDNSGRSLRLGLRRRPLRQGLHTRGRPAAVRVLRPIVESALQAASKSQTTRRTK